MNKSMLRMLVALVVLFGAIFGVIASGMAVGTVFTLLVVPVIYSYLAGYFPARTANKKAA